MLGRVVSYEMFVFFLSYSWGDRTRAFLTRQAQAWSHGARHPGEGHGFSVARAPVSCLVEEVSDEAAGLIGGLQTTGRGPTRT